MKQSLQHYSFMMEQAYRDKQARACFGWIIRNEYEFFAKLSGHSLDEALKTLGVPISYSIEVSKELRGYEFAAHMEEVNK